MPGYLAHKKQRPPRTLQKDYAQGPMEALGRGAVSYERCTPVRLVKGLGFRNSVYGLGLSNPKPQTVGHTRGNARELHHGGQRPGA